MSIPGIKKAELQKLSWNKNKYNSDNEGNNGMFTIHNWRINFS